MADDQVLDALTDLQDAAALILGRLTLMDARLTRRLDRLEATVAEVDDKLTDLTSAVDDAASELQALRDELANAAQPGDLTDEQAARFDQVISALRNATSGPAPEPTPEPV